MEVLYVFLSLCISEALVSGFDLTLVHTNDVHARVEEFNKYGSRCKPDDAAEGKCFGGVSRRMTKLKEIRANKNNVLLLDAGDQFLGTLWFTHYKGIATSILMRMLQYDVMCLGNHEFDKGPEVLAKFLDNMTVPVVSANTDVTLEPHLQLKFTKSIKVAVGGEQIGVIGYLTLETQFISNPGSNVRFTDIISAVTTEVSNLKAEGVNKIIALGHAGIQMDKKVAEIDGVDLVVGGHTNTFLYTGDNPSNEDSEGPYPTVVTQSSGKKTLVVQDYTWGKYLGVLDVVFDNNGDVTSYSGNPVLLNSSVTEDADVLAEVNRLKEPLTKLTSTSVGVSKVILNGLRDVCRLQECNMGNFIADALIDYHIAFDHPNDTWAPASIALMNGGGIRASLAKGEITLGDVLQVMPFGNEIDLITITGDNLRRQLELAVQEWNTVEPPGRFLQMSGLRVVYDLTQPAGQRVVSVEAMCLRCDTPSYLPLKDREEYNIFVSTFLIGGGDGFKFQPIKQERFNTLDSDVLTNYIRKRSPVYASVEGRITFRNDSDKISAASFRTVSYHLTIGLVTLLCASVL